MWTSETSRSQVALGAGESIRESIATSQASHGNKQVPVKTSHGNAVDSEQSCLDQGRRRNDEYTVTGCWFRTS